MKRIITLFLILVVLPSLAFAEDKVLLVIAKNKFRDEELFISKEVLEKKGYSVDIASSSKGTCSGMLGHNIEVDMRLEDVKVLDYKALIFVGGIGAQEYWASKTAHKIIKEAYRGGKIIAAICIAPVILARAGILNNKRATVSPWAKDELTAFGAIYTANGIEIDGNIITADGPGATVGFVDRVVQALGNNL